VIEEVQQDLLHISRENFSIASPRVVASVTSYYDGSRSEERTGFGVYHAENFELAPIEISNSLR
jgi:hypothetical protein